MVLLLVVALVICGESFYLPQERRRSFGVTHPDRVLLAAAAAMIQQMQLRRLLLLLVVVVAAAAGKQ